MKTNNYLNDLKTSLHAIFQPEIIEEWIDPFDSSSLKFFTILVYIMIMLASMIMLAFVAFETGGNAGSYRTVINQLLSCGYGGVSIAFVCSFQ